MRSVLCVGLVLTPASQASSFSDAAEGKAQNFLNAVSPIGRVAQPEECGSVLRESTISRWQDPIDSLQPSLVMTPAAALSSFGNAEDDKAVEFGLQALCPIGRIALPEEMASAIVYLASQGSEMVVDGGMTAQ
ncbi:hypothetical protein M427DRAFT_69715 [Gonapodya prolifera JEL478]|uniref:NAD(P)-binding protein n=1 Tax=Gonapodya prolifera (strain JEL478) TaxID=1344416 RepID=A0A139AG69_GONPJ|nr:hypothetical protein M427DRAFT_69715 [Gonapodya prolifera JEL478]|eukprot:KXS15787.1 hypothetical protein M427DRAFT_69715 [Gonapodya prolifera JEL478]